MSPSQQLLLQGSIYTKVATAQRCAITIEEGRARVVISATDPSNDAIGHLISGEADKMPCVIHNTYIKPLPDSVGIPTCTIVITTF